MKQLSMAGLVSLIGAGSLWAVTIPIYINDVIIQPPTTPPQVDAKAFVNNSTFDVTGTSLPYQTQNTRYFTNNASGIMSGAPGFNFQFLTTTGALNYPAYSFVNYGRVNVSGYSTRGTLFINSTNIQNADRLSGDSSSDIKIVGTNVDLSGSSLRCAQPVDQVFSGFFDSGQVTGLYWGAGQNNVLSNNSAFFQLNGFFGGNLDLPSPSSPTHQVLQNTSGFIFTNFVSVPSFSAGSFGAFVHSNRTGPTSSVVQIVFVATNSVINGNLSVNVRFTPTFFGSGSDAIVEFSNVDYDIVEERNITNYVYLVDSSVNVTNITLVPTNSNPKIPSTYSVSRFTPFSWLSAEPANIPFTNTLIYSPQHRTNRVSEIYAAYSARIGSPNAALIAAGNNNPALSDPTNFHGKVEIFSDQLRQFDTRIKAENFIGIQTRNLQDNLFANIDAPFINFDIGSTNVNLVISNIAPATINRLSGTVSAWSGVWNNLVTNGGAVDNVRYHVMVVDNALTAQTPVTLHRFKAHCTNLTIVDNLKINASMLLDAPSVSFLPGGGVTLPAGSSWGMTNVLRLTHFTNSGVITIPQIGQFGNDRTNAPYTNFINHGSIATSVFKSLSRNFENSGLGTFFTPGSITTSGGILSVDTTTGTVSNGLLASFGSLAINASNLTVRGSTLMSGTTNNGSGVFVRGPLTIAATNRLTDGAGGATNQWITTSGFQLLRAPFSGGSLTNTSINSIADAHATPVHTWAAQDRGAKVIGYSNNLAVGRLVLDGPANATFQFNGLGTTNAIYVDYLELRNGATNYNTALSISSAFYIYYADCNLPPDKLDGAKNGHLRWVRDYTGLNSSTNITYPSGTNYIFNAGLVRSNDIDSDGDGTVNSLDPTPIYVAESIGLAIGFTNVPPIKAVITWNALFNATNILEYRTNVAATNWMTLTNFATGPVNLTARVVDGTLGRFYRVRVLMP